MPKNCEKDGRNMFIHSEKGNEHAIQISFMRESDSTLLAKKW